MITAAIVLSGCGGSGDSSSGDSTSPQQAPVTGGPLQPSGAPPSGAVVTENNQPPAGSGPLPQPSNVDRAQVVKYVECMRQNGIKDFPDPAADGAIQMNGATIDINSEAFKNAQAKCGSLMPGGPAPTQVTTNR
jgi:hypothetical protein